MISPSLSPCYDDEEKLISGFFHPLSSLPNLANHFQNEKRMRLVWVRNKKKLDMGEAWDSWEWALNL